MDELEQKLRQLIAEACTHAPKSLQRRQIISEVHRLVMKSGKLWQEYTPYYNDALQQMWEYCAKHPEEYNPQIKGVITWLDDYLKKRLRNFRDAKYRQRRRQLNSVETHSGQTFDPVANLVAPADIQPVLDMWQKTLDWVTTDPQGVLNCRCFRKCKHINCQALILQRFPPDVPWQTIAANLQLTPAESKDLPKFYSRKCLPLLRQFGINQGYLEQSSPHLSKPK